MQSLCQQCKAFASRLQQFVFSALHRPPWLSDKCAGSGVPVQHGSSPRLGVPACRQSLLLAVGAAWQTLRWQHTHMHCPSPPPHASGCDPAVGMWKQPSVSAVLSEEERLREAVFAQVYAELLQKDNKDISFNAQP